MQVDARATAPREMNVSVGMSQDPYMSYTSFPPVSLTTVMQTFVFDYPMDADKDETARIEFNFGLAGTAQIILDDVKLIEEFIDE
ncbi:MAG: hypothetical protein JW969_16780 [Spirochaetales bacterium]|nr:hypothetical protein [Spirochaetales bacterium]